MNFFKRKNIKQEEQDYTVKDWLKELDWANVYHDSIRGKSYLENLSLNIGRWAGNYAFFYVLNRIMHDFKPKTIIEFGLGESTKFISSCIKGLDYDCKYVVIEQNMDWKIHFQSNFQLTNNTSLIHCPIERKEINGFSVNTYKDLKNQIDFQAELYIVDGPHGSERFSRFDICYLAEKFTKESEFVILIDDCQRKGEQDTFEALEMIFKEKEIIFFKAKYSGVKTVSLIVSNKYKYSTTF